MGAIFLTLTDFKYVSEVEHTDCPLFKDIPSGRGSGFQVIDCSWHDQGFQKPFEIMKYLILLSMFRLLGTIP